MDDGSIFIDTTVGLLDNEAVSDSFGSEFNFDADSSSNMLIDPSLNELSPFSSTDSQFLTPATSVLSPQSSIDYFGDQCDNFTSCVDSITVVPQDTVVLNTELTAETEPHIGNIKTTKPKTKEKDSTMSSKTRKASAMATEPSMSTRASKKQKTKVSVVIKKEEDDDTTQPPPSKQAKKLQSSSKRTSKKDDAQRTKNLERNRIAASKCRQKKKEWMAELEETKLGMEQRHTSLRVEYLQLLDEVTRIKNHLMTHAVCNDPNINFWIEKEALSFVARCHDPANMKRSSIVSTGSSSFALLSPTDSDFHQLSSPTCKPHSINLDYMPDELLVAD